jgi:hypothetical protein
MRNPDERRDSERRRVLYAGEMIVAGDGTPVAIECTIRSLSLTGAGLRAPAAAPRAFDLKVVRDGTVRQARTVWAVGPMRGVTFLDEPPGDRPAPMSPADLRRLFRVVKND